MTPCSACHVRLYDGDCSASGVAETGASLRAISPAPKPKKWAWHAALIPGPAEARWKKARRGWTSEEDEASGLVEEVDVCVSEEGHHICTL